VNPEELRHEESSLVSDPRKSFVAHRYALDWLRLVSKYGITPYHRYLMNLLQALRELVPGTRVLDCAAGTGYPFALEFSRRGWDLYTVDISQILVRSQVERFSGEGVALRCAVGDSEMLPFGDSAFGLTYCLQATWYFPHLTEVLREMARVTAPRGVLVFDIMNVLSPRIVFWHLLGRLRSGFVNLRGAILSGPKTEHLVVEKATSPFAVERALASLGYKFRRLIPPAIASLAPDGGRLHNKFYLFSPRLVYVCARAQNPDGEMLLQAASRDH